MRAYRWQQARQAIARRSALALRKSAKRVWHHQRLLKRAARKHRYRRGGGGLAKSAYKAQEKSTLGIAAAAYRRVRDAVSIATRNIGRIGCLEATAISGYRGIASMASASYRNERKSIIASARWQALGAASARK